MSLLEYLEMQKALGNMTQNLSISWGDPYYFEDHRVQDLAVVPGAAYIEFALAMAKNRLLRAPSAIRNIQFKNALIVSEQDASMTELTLVDSGDSSWLFRCEAPTSDFSNPSLTYAHMELGDHRGGQTIARLSTASLQEARQKFHKQVPSEQFYSELAKAGNGYGSKFQTLQNLWVGQSEAVGEFKNSQETTHYGFAIDPFLLDGCVQLFSSIVEKNGRTYILEQIDELLVLGTPSGPCWGVATLTTAEGDGVYSGTVYLYDEDGIALWSIEGLQIRLLGNTISENSTDGPVQTVAVSATFTAEPLEDSLAFWHKELGINGKIEFAPYNQVFQQLLMPDSLLNRNEVGLNAILVRLEDWAQNRGEIPLRVSATEKETILSSHQRHKVRDNLEIAHLNQYETEYVYQEIFEDLAYLKHGIIINDGDCIIDIGANIGLFTLFVQQQASDTTVYSFEPSPPVFKLLNANAQLYGEHVHVFNLGVSDRKKEAEFTFYQKSSVFSSFAADKEADEHAIRAVIENMVRDNEAVDSEQVDQLVTELISDRLTSTNYTCQLTSLSDIIRENEIEQIDLLKLDAEKSELPVLQGILDEDWPKIKQIVMEVHDQEGPVIEEVTQILRNQGFELAIEEEQFLQNSGLYNIFAKQPNENNGTTSQYNDFKRAISDNVSDLLEALDVSAGKLKVPTILSVCPPSPAVSRDVAKIAALEDAEQTIIQAVDGMSNVSCLLASDVAKLYPVEEYFDADGERLGHIPYTTAYFSALGTAITRRATALTRSPYKVIVLDCDNTLWKGVCGEDGVQGIELSDPFIMLQQFMQAQMDAGMILCLCSKNVEEDVWAVFDNRTDMLLKRDNIVSWRINWQPKSQNLQELAHELQLSLDSFIFLDDNPVECAEVRASCPQVLTLQLPADAETIPRFLAHIWAFDRLGVTSEDKKRTAMYQENLERERSRTSNVTLEGFLESLNLDILVQEMQPENLERVSQLTYRTNQFNFSTIRRTTGEIQQACDANELTCLVATVADRFGDYGLVGVILYAVTENKLVVDTLLLSCRVLGRGVEHAMVAQLGRIAEEHGLEVIEMPFSSTKKNQPALDFLESIASEHKHLSNQDFVYVLPAPVATALTYKPSIDRDYAERAMQRSVNDALAKGAPESMVSSFDLDHAAKIATELYSAETILAQILLQPAPSVDNPVTTEYVAPTSELQNSVVNVWQEILGLKQIGMHDNFFEIGGSSLKGVQLIAQLKRHLSIELGIVDLFAAPTVSTMTELIEQQRSGSVIVSAATEESESRGAKRRELLGARRRR